MCEIYCCCSERKKQTDVARKEIAILFSIFGEKKVQRRLGKEEKRKKKDRLSHNASFVKHTKKSNSSVTTKHPPQPLTHSLTQQQTNPSI